VNGSVVTAAAWRKSAPTWWICTVSITSNPHRSRHPPGFLDGFAKLESRAETYHRSYRTWKDIGDRLRQAEENARKCASNTIS